MKRLRQQLGGDRSNPNSLLHERAGDHRHRDVNEQMKHLEVLHVVGVQRWWELPSYWDRIQPLKQREEASQQNLRLFISR